MQLTEEQEKPLYGRYKCRYAIYENPPRRCKKWSGFGIGGKYCWQHAALMERIRKSTEQKK